MTFTRREEKAIRNQVKLGIMDAWKQQKEDIVGICMTRADCLGIHQGRNANNNNGVHPANNNKGNGNGNNKDAAAVKDPLLKQKIKFWSKLIGLISVITVLLSTLTGILIAHYLPL